MHVSWICLPWAPHPAGQGQREAEAKAASVSLLPQVPWPTQWSLKREYQSFLLFVHLRGGSFAQLCYRGRWYGELVRVRSRVLLVQPDWESSYLVAGQRKSLRALLQGLRGPGWQDWLQQSQSPAVEKCDPGYLSVTVTCVQT